VLTMAMDGRRRRRSAEARDEERGGWVRRRGRMEWQPVVGGRRVAGAGEDLREASVGVWAVRVVSGA
jgi:hypothetical protein